MPRFHAATVTDIRQETPDCVSIQLDLPPAEMKDFDFKPGQFLSLRKIIDGEEVRRSYSICAAPEDHELRVAVKQVPGGRFSTWANERLEVGDTLDIMPPMGRFTYKEVKGGHYVAFAAGSGITPVLSILRHTLISDPDSQFTLFFGNRGLNDVIFRESLEALKNKFLNRLSIYHLFSREDRGSDLFNGRLDGEKLKQFAKLLFDPKEVAAYYMCGPQPMLEDLSETLIEMGVAENKIHFELFGTPVEARQPRQNQDSDVAAKVSVRLDGNDHHFTMSDPGNNLLDAALNNGLDLPFACKGGVCSTCRAQLVTGEVDMVINYALEPEEVKAGYILTCQSYPKSENVSINFDV